ncbi:MAG TPA: hypothetical protein VF576_01705 [Rubricoccaceae bacterium]
MPTLPPRSSTDRRPMSAPQAVALWAVYSIVFAVGGGLGAGIPAFLFEAAGFDGYDATLYAIMFGITGFIAYRLAQRVAEG